MKKSFMQFLKGAVIGAAGGIVGVTSVVLASGYGFKANDWISNECLDKFGSDYRYIRSYNSNFGRLTKEIEDDMGVGLTCIVQPIAKDWYNDKLWKISDEGNVFGYEGFTNVDMIYAAICVGDINVDGVVNIRDSHEMLRYTTYRQIGLATNMVDYILHRNRDGAIDIRPRKYLPDRINEYTPTRFNVLNSGFVHYGVTNDDVFDWQKTLLALKRPFDIRDYKGRKFADIDPEWDMGIQQFETYIDYDTKEERIRGIVPELPPQ